MVWSAPSGEVLTLARVALLATDKDEFAVEDIENLLLPAEASVRAAIADDVRGFAARFGEDPAASVHNLGKRLTKSSLPASA